MNTEKCPNCGAINPNGNSFFFACGTDTYRGNRSAACYDSELSKERVACKKAEAELELSRENLRILLSNGFSIRCHEGGGPEDLNTSIVLTVERLRKELAVTRRKLEEVTSFVWGAVHNARPACGSSMARWVCVRNALGVGSTTAAALCREHGVDPHEVLKSRCDYSEEAQKGGAS